jgi:hypothetical protein
MKRASSDDDELMTPLFLRELFCKRLMNDDAQRKDGRNLS